MRVHFGGLRFRFLTKMYMDLFRTIKQSGNVMSETGTETTEYRIEWISKDVYVDIKDVEK